MKTNHAFFKLLLLLLLMLASAFNCNPSGNIEGTVFDEFKKPIKAEVMNLDNGFVTYADSFGNFSIKGKLGDRLLFKYAEKYDKEIKISKITGLTVYFDDIEKIKQEALQKELEKREKDNRRTEYAEERAAAVHDRKERREKDALVKSHEREGNPLKNSVVGKITDETELPLPGVSVVIRGTTTSAAADIDGYYGIDAKKGDILEFSYIGYRTAAVTVTDSVMNIKMQPDASTLEEVVVVGYDGDGESDYSDRPVSIRGVATRSSSRKERAKVVKAAPAGDAMSVAAPAAEESSVTVKSYTDKRTKGADLKAGQLTAGEVNDFSKWDYWEDLTKVELKQWQELWQMSPAFRYSVVLTNNAGYPVINRILHLKDESGDILWTARTDNTGRAELWLKPEDISLKTVTDAVTIADDKGKVIIAAPKEFHKGINTFVYDEACAGQDKVDIAFMIDATGSMGDEIKYLQAELYDVITRTEAALPDINLRMGSTFYRDNGDEYLTRSFDFTRAVPDVISFIKNQSANGGGDTPEAVVEAYEVAINEMGWDDEARTKLLFVLLDAPPHHSAENVAKLLSLAKKAAERGIRIIPVAASGIDKSTEYLMRAMALQTNGTYLFITNHSGIGNNHIEPSTDSYTVEMLNDLILRVILQNTAVADCTKNDNNNNLPVNTRLDSQLDHPDIANTIKLTCYPNPTAGPVTVSLDTEADALYLFDTTGKLILYRNNKSNRYDLDLSGLPNAVYYVKVMVGNKSLMGKIIKK